MRCPIESRCLGYSRQAGVDEILARVVPWPRRLCLTPARFPRLMQALISPAKPLGVRYALPKSPAVASEGMQLSRFLCPLLSRMLQSSKSSLIEVLMISSPFPGMDPFLEINPRWEVFHGWFIRKLAENSMRRARELSCDVDVERDVYGREPTGELVLLGEPDLLARNEPAFGRPEPLGGRGGVALAEPRAIHEVVLDPDEMETQKQQYLVVRESGEWARVLAVVELLSFANKEGSYAPKYREKRSRLLASMAHFMDFPGKNRRSTGSFGTRA